MRCFFFSLSHKHLHFNVTWSPKILGDTQSGSYEGRGAGGTLGQAEAHWVLATPLTLQQGLGHEPRAAGRQRLLRFRMKAPWASWKGAPKGSSEQAEQSHSRVWLKTAAQRSSAQVSRPKGSLLPSPSPDTSKTCGQSQRKRDLPLGWELATGVNKKVNITNSSLLQGSF